ncbi:alpha/beta hydrolase [Pseudalkalibacillus sp. SCS-8]|uniref:alpha/beta hydrolase n=1 Tax=Pseudalkalibacillus nanhaiensis TaxID=3115291 RepID=UPI0032DB6988
MLKKKGVKFGIGLLSILLIINIAASFYFYDLAIKRDVKEFLAGNKDLEVSAEAMDTFLNGDWRSWYRAQDFERWEIQSADGLKLQGYFLEAKKPTEKTVLFAHGYLGDGQDMGIYAEHYYEELGYNVLTVDLRGHEKSEGDYIGFGWHDRLDITQWIDTLVEQRGQETEIVLHGVSMGAATVLMASGEKLPDNVKAIIADSPFTSVYDLFEYQMNRMYNLPDFPLLPTTSLVTKMKAGYSFTEASALDQVKKAEAPILYIHGNDDVFVPTAMSKELYENTKSEAEFVTFDGANHSEAFVSHREDYEVELEEFLNKHMD